MDESNADIAECRRKVGSGRKVAGAARSVVNARGLEFECERGIDKALVVPVLMYISEIMIRREKLNV